MVFKVRPVETNNWNESISTSACWIPSLALYVVAGVRPRLLRAVCSLLFLLVVSSCCGYCDVVFVRSPNGSPAEQQQLQVAAQFYGQDLTLITASTNQNDRALSIAVERKVTLAVAVAANALPFINHQVLLRTLRQWPGHNVPLLILGVTPDTDFALLETWSGGAAIACRRLGGRGRFRYIMSNFEGLTRQLSSLDNPFQGNDAAYFVLGESSNTQQITKIRDDHQVYPVFIETTLGRQKVFLATAPFSGLAVTDGNADPVLNAFATIAPVMMLIRYVAGERGWHPVHHYANLTIDDPWLREPYGSVHYKGLLTEMERHDFHSTIAFIPWNYDRSEPEVVSLFRNHPDRFSICVHGDNHDHKEFTDYQSKPLALQVRDLAQSLARMDRFQMQTGIPYDKVMVFPHSIAPERTLETLKTYNFLATINSSNVPMDRRNPPLFPFAVRPVTLSFADFASIRRYPAKAPDLSGLVAMNEFLENPLLLYCHHDFFADGMDAFDVVADQINRLQPDTKWRGLAEIVRHLYLIRLRDDDNYDVLSFTGTMCLENVFARDAIFYVRKEEIDRPASVSVDRQSWAYSVHDGYLEMRIPVSSGKSRTVSITYGSALESRPISIEKRSVRVYCLRMASDFRDIIIARYALGRRFIRLYNDHEGPLTFVLVCAFAVVTCCILGIWRLRVMIKSRGARQVNLCTR